MSIVLPLEKMTLAEKLEIMELLWADISKEPAQLPSPSWHREILEERKRLVAEGQLQFLDWEKAVGELREDLCG